MNILSYSYVILNIDEILMPLLRYIITHSKHHLSTIQRDPDTIPIFHKN